MHCKLIYKKKKSILKETKGTKAQQESTPRLQRICQLTILEHDRLEMRTYYSFFFMEITGVSGLRDEKKAEMQRRRKRLHLHLVVSCILSLLIISRNPFLIINAITQQRF